MTLQEIGLKHKTDKATYHKYCDFYQENLPNQDFDGRLLEIGIMDGASLRMWREYYPKAEIIGVDIYGKNFEIEGVTMLKLDATDIEAMKELGNFDIIVDDGSHMTLEQQISFNWLYNNQLNYEGHYVLEDLHTSLMPNYINSKYTTLDILKRFNGNKKYYKRDETEADSMTCIIRANR